MRYGVLGDIHGNLEALTAVVSAMRAEGVDVLTNSPDAGFASIVAADLDQDGVAAEVLERFHSVSRFLRDAALALEGLKAFLAQHLGGRAEPVGDDVARSTAQVRAGGEFLGAAKGAGPATGK